MLVSKRFHPDVNWIKDVRLADYVPAYSTPFGAMFNTDAADVLKRLPSSSVDLVMTSPPFALTRKKEYGNEPVERYLEWFTPFCLEIRPVVVKGRSQR